MIPFFIRIYKSIQFRFNKNKKFKTEDAFYTYLFTKNPSWSTPEPNEDETLRWEHIKDALKTCNGSTEDILEIGCGRGWLSNKLTKHGTVTGIDPVLPVIKYAQKLFPAIKFYSDTPSGFAQKFPEKKFDLIVSTEVIEHVTDKEQFLKDINMLLKPNGVFILTTPRLEHYADAMEVYGTDNEQPIEDWMSEQQIQNLFKKTGFHAEHKSFFSALPNINRVVFITQLFAGRKTI